MLSQQRLTSRVFDLLGIGNRNDLTRWLPRGRRYWFGSGREALRQVFLNLVRDGKRRVGLPAYTCCVVHRAAQDAGCEIVYYDSGVIAEVKEVERILDRVDVLVVSYNFGLLSDIESISGLCTKKKVVLVEDCAQALGVSVKGRLVGSFGNYAIFSFGISKNVGFCGGMVVTDTRFETNRIKGMPKVEILKAIMKVTLGEFIFHPWIYGMLHRFLSTQLHKKQPRNSFIENRYVQKVVFSIAKRYKKILALRLVNQRELWDRGGKEVIRSEIGGSGLYGVIQVNNPRAVRLSMLRRGIEVGRMYSFRSASQKFVKARRAERGVLTFSLYRSRKEIDQYIGAIHELETVGEWNR